MIGIAYHVVALTFVFKFLKKILTADIWQGLDRFLTPKFLTAYFVKKEKIRQQKEIEQKKKANQEAREHARKYEDTYFSISYILQDRAELFAGYEDIKWEYGKQQIDYKKGFTPEDSRDLAFKIFFEVSIYRKAFIDNNKWTPAMEMFWRKIVPKQFCGELRTPENYFEDQMKKELVPSLGRV